MEKCDHVFVGNREGVRCEKCGLQMTATEYATYLQPESKEEKPKRQTKKKEKTNESFYG